MVECAQAVFIMRRPVSRPPSSLPVLIAVCAFTALFALMFICTRSLQAGQLLFWEIGTENVPTAAIISQATSSWGLPTHRSPGAPLHTPTPDAPHPLPPIRKEPEQYTVQAGDTLGRIATRYGVSVEQIAQENQMLNPNLLSVGQVLLIPVPIPQGISPAFKVIPDSELVYGPANIGFNIEQFIQQQGGYLAYYREQVDTTGGPASLTGAQIVQLVAQDYSVNPRLMLALLQHQSGWLTNPTPERPEREYPLGFPDPSRQGLYRQLTWAANNLNRGFYLWRVNGVAAWVLSDSSIVPANPTINAGTAAIQNLFSLLGDRASWETAISEQGFFATYNSLFGYPFDIAIEPSLPAELTQPPMQLPFEMGSIWAFTGGPHAAWGDGAAWAALDFAPPGDAVGCITSNDWVVAVADGLILRAENGAVVQDLDGDGYEQSGWVVLYMHIETRDRVQPGSYIRAGEHIGHASCEGGISTGTHLHLARRFNGEWIAADQNLPFILDGWVSSGAGSEYDGYLQRSNQRLEAYAGRAPGNEIQR